MLNAPQTSPIPTYEEVFGTEVFGTPALPSRTPQSSPHSSSLDAREMFPILTGLPWTPLRRAVWCAQKISDPINAHRLATAYEEEIGFVHLLRPGLVREESKAHMARRLTLTAAAYRARAQELCAEIARTEVLAILADSEYFQRHPEMEEEFLA